MNSFPVSDNQNWQDQLADTSAKILQSSITRNFKPDPIPPKLLHQLIASTVNVRTSWNLPVLPIIIVQHAQQRLALVEAAFGQPQILQAPLTVVFGATSTLYADNWTEIDSALEHNVKWTEDPRQTSKSNIQQFQQPEITQEIAIRGAAVQGTHLMLAAQNMGLATCAVTIYDEDRVKEIIGVWEDSSFLIGMMVAVGYSAEPDLPSNPTPTNYRVFINRLGELYAGRTRSLNQELE